MITLEALDSGLRLVIETMPSMRSVSVGVWAVTGSRHEFAEEAGVSHFVEHLLFKGTESRSAEQIAVAIDSVGGDLNARTDRETTSFYAKVPCGHLERAVDLLSDMICRPALAKSALETELNVIAEEIKRYEDEPDELVQDVFCESFWPGNPVGRLVTGDLECLARLSGDDIRAFMRRRYTADNLIVSVAGNVDPDDVRRLVTQKFAEVPPAPFGPSAWKSATPLGGAIRCETRDLEQVHLVMGWPGSSAADERRYAQALVDGVFGATPSSRLFQRIREDRGLVYSVWSEAILFCDTGALTVCADTGPGNVAEVMRLVLQEAAALAEDSLGPAELAVAKEQFKGSTALALESTDSRESRNARGVVVLGRPVSFEELESRIEAVSLEAAKAVAREVFSPGLVSLAAVGPITADELGQALAGAGGPAVQA
jgi:predicted Zn-dependent peptidase